MTQKTEKPNASEALKRVLAAKKSAMQDGGGFSGPVGRMPEKSMQRQAAALNKPAFRRASKRG